MYVCVCVCVQYCNKIRDRIVSQQQGYIIFSGGGTGFVGSQLIKSLSLEGISCTCISRMPGPGRMSWVSHE